MFEFLDVLRRLLLITKATDNEQRQRAPERVDGERTTMSIADDDVPTGRAGIYIPSEQRMATIDTLFPYELAPGILTPPAPRHRRSSTNYGQLRRWAPTPLAVLSENTEASENVPGWRSADTLTSSASPESEENPANAINGSSSRKPKWIAKIGNFMKKKNRTAPTSQATLAGASQAQIDVPAAAEAHHSKPFWKRRVQVKPLIKKLLHRPHHNHGTTTHEQPSVNPTEAPPAERAEATPSRSIDDPAKDIDIDIDVRDQDSEVVSDRASFRSSLPSDLRSNGKLVDEIWNQETGVLIASRGALSSNLSSVGAVDKTRQHEAEAIKTFHRALPSDISEPVDKTRQQDIEAVNVLHRTLPSDIGEPVSTTFKTLHHALPSDLREPVNKSRTLPSDLREPLDIRKEDTEVIKTLRGSLPSDIGEPVDNTRQQETDAVKVLHPTSDLSESVDSIHRTRPSDLIEPVDVTRNRESGVLSASRGTLSSNLSSIGEVVAKQGTEVLDASQRTLPSDPSEPVDDIRNHDTGMLNASRGAVSSSLSSIGEVVTKHETEAFDASYRTLHSDLSESVDEIRDQEPEVPNLFRSTVPSDVFSIDEIADEERYLETAPHHDASSSDLIFTGETAEDGRHHALSSIDEIADEERYLETAPHHDASSSDLRFIGETAEDGRHHALSSIDEAADEERYLETAHHRDASSSDLIFTGETAEDGRHHALSSIDEIADEERYLETAPHHDASSSDLRFIGETAEDGRHHALSSIDEAADEERYLETAHHRDASSSDLRFIGETAEDGRHHEPAYYEDVPYRIGSIDEEDEEIDYQFDMRRHGVAPVDGGPFSSGLRLPLDEISEEEMEQMASVSDASTFLQPLDQVYQEHSRVSSEGASVLDMIQPAIEHESHLAVVTNEDIMPTDLVQATQIKLADTYDFLHPLGAGGQSQVVLARHKPTGQLRVVKCFTSASVWDWHTAADGTKLPMEAALMQSMQEVPSCPPTILRMHEFINVAPQYALVTEYLGEEWVDLFTYMDMAGRLSEETVRHIFHQVISATSWLHGQNILHNDLKDENILINQVTLSIKLIDFGSANAVTPSSRQFSGTRKFMSPQVLDCLENQGAAWSPTDQEVWCLGTLLFILLFGTDPFSDEYEAYQVDIQVKLSCIMARQSRRVSAKAAKLVEGLLERDHRRRWSLAMAQRAEFWDDNQ
ncbi:hypothetical protein HDU87_002907 [Geranomyces variabilis]|uniref:Protein kinase domain-containing protein n=1 Tax=Geranomyces variabilis TaxID=109894 RepID=A0AAD5TKL9_9FUNG|nr:hypothetical protein HDU87_002907 [Geranomyces variabilis]